MMEPPHIWNVIYNVRSNNITLQLHQIVRQPRKKRIPKSKRNLLKTDETSLTLRGGFEHDRSMIQPWNCRTEPVRLQSVLFRCHQRILCWKLQRFALRLSTQFSPNAAPARKSHTPTSCLPGKMAIQLHQILRLPRKATLQAHQILHLPRKITLMIDCGHIWNVIYNARSNRHHPPTSPDTAPAKTHFVLKITTFCASAVCPNFAGC